MPVSDSNRWGASIGRSYNFSNFPNLQEVKFAFTAGWPGRGLPWIPMALSTLRPATSPRLSAVRLCLACLIVDRSVKTLVKDTGNDLRQVADEASRIEREFEGVVDFTVVPDSVFEMVLDTLGVRFHSSASIKLINFHLFLKDLPAPLSSKGHRWLSTTFYALGSMSGWFKPLNDLLPHALVQRFLLCIR